MRCGLRIAMIGTRGVPATFGGIEHHVEEVGARLAARGHDVTVYCRTNYGDSAQSRPTAYRGMRLRHLRTVSSKHLDAIVHSALSSGDALLRRYDIVHYHGLGPGLTAPLPRVLSRARVAITVHGQDNQRAKWGPAAKAVLETAAWMSAHVPEETIVVSEELTEIYARRWHRRTDHIVNGVAPPNPRPARLITERFGLVRDKYLLYLGRLVPEKAPDLLLRAFRRLPGDLRLIIAGGSSFTDNYVRELERRSDDDPRVTMVGYVYGELLEELYTNAAAFVLPSSLEGMPLTLLEAASYATPIVASSILPHLEVLGGERPGRRVFPPGEEDELLAAIQRSLADQPGSRSGAADLRTEVLQRYSWDEAVDKLEAVYYRMARRSTVAG